MKIYSKIKPGLLLHIINRLDEITERTDLIPEQNFIQCATLCMNEGKTFIPHYHIKKKRTYNEQIAQESWVIISGKVKCYFYDIDNKTILETPILSPGDASFT